MTPILRQYTAHVDKTYHCVVLRGGRMRAAVLGLGEAGTLYSAGLVAKGGTVVGYDPADNAPPAGVFRAETAEGAVRGADAVLSLVGGKAAAAAAGAVAPALADDAV